MFCPKCGKQIPEGARFCGGCGNPVQPPAQMPSGGQTGLTEKPRKPTVLPKHSNSAGTFKQQKQEIPKAQPIPEAQPHSAPPAISANLPSGIEMTQSAKEEERKNRKLTIILFIVLAVLVLVAVGMGIYYFKVLKNSEDGSVTERDEEIEVQEETEETEESDAADSEQTDQTSESQEAEEEIEGVVSETNEVVADKILENIPKAVYNYPFNEDLGNARVVVRNDPETEPEETDDIEPQYVRGVDGKAVYLDETYGIKLDDVEKVGESYTIAFWMKADRLCDWSPFIHIGQDSLDANKRVRLWLAQKTDGVSVAPIISSERVETSDSFEIRPGQSMPNTIEPGVWYHIAFTVDASRSGSRSGSLYGTLYVAGQRIGEGDIIPGTMNVDDFEVYLGINCWDQLYPVAFDDVKIWNQVLDGDQIQELYQAYE